MVRPVSAAAAACVLLAAAVGLVAPADVAPDEMAAAGDEADGPVQSETTAAPGLVEVPLNEQADLRSSVTQISHDIQGGRIHVQLVEGAQCAAPVFRLRFSGAALSVDAEWSLTGPGRHTAQYSLCYPRAAAESTYFLELVVLSCASSAAFLGDRATLMAACLEDPTGNVLNAPYLFRGESFYIFAMKILSKKILALLSVFSIGLLRRAITWRITFTFYCSRYMFLDAPSNPESIGGPCWIAQGGEQPPVPLAMRYQPVRF